MNKITNTTQTGGTHKMMNTVIYVLSSIILVSCILNYILVLYRSNWQFGTLESTGWLMAVIGWVNVVLY